MNNIFIVIVHFGKPELTQDCLRSIYQSPQATWSTIIINNSPNRNLNGIISPFQGVSTVNPGKNLGFAAANNLGIRSALKKGARILILLNNDTIAGENLIPILADFAGKNPDTGIVSPKIYFAPGYEYHPERYGKKDLGKVIWYAGGVIDWKNMYASHIGVDEVDSPGLNPSRKTDFATGCCMLINREVVEKTGLIDEKYFLYYEDVAYSQKAIKSGFKVSYCPKAHLWHKNARSSGPGSSVHIYYQSRNRLYFGMKYAPWKTKIALVRESLRKLSEGGIESGAVIDFYIGRMGKGRLK